MKARNSRVNVHFKSCRTLDINTLHKSLLPEKKKEAPNLLFHRMEEYRKKRLAPIPLHDLSKSSGDAHASLAHAAGFQWGCGLGPEMA